ncbi:hypothetical protein ACOMHN_039446 [Nucella lapillus]
MEKATTVELFHCCGFLHCCLQARGKEDEDGEEDQVGPDIDRWPPQSDIVSPMKTLYSPVAQTQLAATLATGAPARGDYSSRPVAYTLTPSSGKEASMQATKDKDGQSVDLDKATTEASGSGLPRKHKCSKCKYSTRNKILYDHHSCEQQDEESNPEEETVITLKVDEGRKHHCSECDVWGQGNAFEEHLMCHIILRPYQCLYCSRCFVNRRDVGRHVVKAHTGMKMNCALRALKRAKALMKATLESGSFQFYACVAGKVPLTADPEKVKTKQKKSRRDGWTGDTKDSVQASFEGSASSKDACPAKPVSGNGQDGAGSSTASSESSSASDASVSTKTAEDLKGPDSGLPSAGKSHHNDNSPSPVRDDGSSGESEEPKNKTISLSSQKTASSADLEVPSTDAVTEEMTAPTETTDQTNGENITADCEDRVKDSLESTLNTPHTTAVASKPDELNSDKKASEINASLCSELDGKSSDTVDTNTEKEGADKSATKMDSPNNLPAEAANSTTKEDNNTNSTTKSNETTDFASQLEGKPKDSVQASENSDTKLGLESSAEKLLTPDGKSDEMETTATADTDNPSAETMDLTQTVQENTTPATENEEAEESTSSKTDLSVSPKGEDNPSPKGEDNPSTKGEDNPSPKGEDNPSPKGEDNPSPTGEDNPSPKGEDNPSPKGEDNPSPKREDNPDPHAKTEETPMETDEPMDASPTPPNPETDATEQPKIAEAEGVVNESSETNMEVETDSGLSKEKSTTEDENDKNDTDSKESSEKASVPQDVAKEDSMKAEETESPVEKNQDATEPENKPETSNNTTTTINNNTTSNNNPDSAPVEETSTDSPRLLKKTAKRWSK